MGKNSTLIFNALYETVSEKTDTRTALVQRCTLAMAYDAVVVDGMNLAYRSWHKQRDLKTSAGVHTGLEFGFIRNFLTTVRENYPARVYIAWDGTPERCLAIFPAYKEKRRAKRQAQKKLDAEQRAAGNESVEAPWGPRLERLQAVMAHIAPTLYHPKKEADEQIVALVKEQERQGKTTLIYSTDDDMKQLVTDLTHVHTWEGPVDRNAVKEAWGVYPEQLARLRAISGDTSDEVPGVPRVETTAKIRLVLETESLEDMLTRIDTATYFKGTQKQKMIDGKEVIRRNFQIMNLNSIQTKPDLVMEPSGDVNPVLDLCRELECHSLLTRKEWQLFGIPKNGENYERSEAIPES